MEQVNSTEHGVEVIKSTISISHVGINERENVKEREQQDREHSPGITTPKKRTRVNKRERKEIKKQQNIKEGKINQKQRKQKQQQKPPKPQEVQYEPILREMVALPHTEEETNGITIMTYNVIFFGY